MKSLLFFCFIFFLLLSESLGQCPDDISLNYSTQFDIDTFAMNYPNCEILRSISLSNSSSDPITNLRGFENIDSLTHDLRLTELSSLSDLDGLQGLKGVDDLNITNCDKLTTTSALESLKIITGNLTLESNELLNNLSGFANVDSLGSRLQVIGLPSLVNLNGLQNLKRVFDLTISGCPSIESIEQLESLKTVSRHFSVENNGKLNILGSFAALEFVGGDFTISRNPELVDIRGFNKLGIIDDGHLEISFNNNLQIIEGFNALTRIEDELELENESLQIVSGFNALLNSIIEFNNYQNLMAVTGFSSLQSALHISFSRNPMLMTIPQFEALDSIGNNFTIEYNDVLSYIAGFDNLRIIKDEFKIFINNSLQSLPTFSNLESLGKLEITLNPVLSSLNGFQKVNELKQLSIDRNEMISSVPNFDLVESIIGGIGVIANPLLENFPTFASLKRTNDLRCSGNASLKSIDCCQKLDSTESLFWIINCETLSSIAGFDNLKRSGAFSISSNPILQQMPKFETLQKVSSYLTINDNESISKVEGFNALTGEGRFEINRNNSLTTIDGFDAFIIGNIEIANNKQLTSVEAFDLMEDGTVKILSNVELTSLPAFGNLNSSIHITITGNKKLPALNAFDKLNVIEGDLLIRNNELLQSISGFNQLTHAKEININGVEIQSIPRFNSLRTVGTEAETPMTVVGNTGLYLEEMPKLPAIIGFESLDTIKGSLHIVSNTALKEVNAFENLKYVYRDIVLFENEELEQFEGFHDLEIIGSKYFIRENNQLKQLPPTHKLQAINNVWFNSFGFNPLEISGDSISSLSGLRNLATLKGSLLIVGTNLESLAGLENLDPSEDIIKTYIHDNPKLSDCRIAFLCEKIQDINFICEVENNTTGCNDCAEIECLNNSIEGVVYYDYNENKIRDTDEPSLDKVRISIDPDQIELIPRNDGQYVYQCEEGKKYTIAPQLNSLWKITTDSLSYKFNFNMDEPKNKTKDFGLVPTFDLHEGTLGLISEPTRCNTDVQFVLSYENTGTYEETGEVVILLDPLVTFVEADPMPSSLTHDQAVWDFSALRPFQKNKIKMLLSMPDELSTGALLQLNSEMKADGQVLANYKYTPEVICSYDPNDKLVMPSDSTSKNLINQEEKLTYTIRFQNEGNAAAINIYIQDTLNVNLNQSTFRVIDSSFPVLTSINRNVLRFDFDNIWLPPTSLGEVESQGYVTFSIAPNPNLPPETTISNEAYIYFDSNAPIQTNTAISTIKNPTSISNIGNLSPIAFVPNPANAMIYFDTELEIQKVEIFTLNGQLLYTGNENKIAVSELAAGLYVFKVETKADSFSELISIVH